MASHECGLFILIRFNGTRLLAKDLRCFFHAVRALHISQPRVIFLLLDFLFVQATELCREKAADLQTTLVSLRWQSKHVEQRLMAVRAVRETLRIAQERSEAELYESQQVDRDINSIKLPQIATTSVTVSTNAAGWGCCTNDGRTQQRRKGTGRNDTIDAPDASVDSERVSFPMAPDKSLPSCDIVGETGRGAMQLVSKMQALTRAITLVETVLQRMEERASSFLTQKYQSQLAEKMYTPI